MEHNAIKWQEMPQDRGWALENYRKWSEMGLEMA